VGFRLPVTIADTVKQIQEGKLVLPAIQREFVWEASQIERLFDSVLRGYPIGSFLSWQVQPETAQQFRFYGFLRDYHEKHHPYSQVLDLTSDHAVNALLDGQQRLTSLNIGLRGSFASRVSGGWWQNEKSFPIKRLYINVLAEASENELGIRYDFRMLTEAQAQAPEDGSAHWFPVHRIYEIQGFPGLMAELAARELGNQEFASELVGRLYEAVHSTPALYFYEEDDQDVEKVLDIFIRVNSGGTILSYSDLLLSIATAQWSKRDAREEIRTLVTTLNSAGQGFRFPRDTILKTGLVLVGVADIGFKVRNFNQANMAALEKQWDDVSRSLTLAAHLFADFGLSDATLTANSVLIPVAYYVHKRGLEDDYRTKISERADREALQGWVFRSLIKQGVWGSGLDTLLRELRDTIDEHGADSFPVPQIESRMAARGKSLVFTDEEIADLLELKYGSKRTFAVLATMFPHVDTRNIFHVDHVYPRSLITPTKLAANGIDEEERGRMGDRRDMLPNLQLLEGPENIAKSNTTPEEWARDAYATEQAYSAYLDRNQCPYLPAAPNDFNKWFDARSAMLTARLRSLLDSAGRASAPMIDEQPARRDDELAHSELPTP
jgi:Protein of unknown function DUF262